MTYFELLKEVERLLENDNAAFEAKQIVLTAANTDNTGFMKLRQQNVEKEVIEKCFEFVKKRNEGLPIYYVLGVCEFYSYEFFVGKGVLVPRDDTEILVDTALDAIKNIKNPKVLDLCSGSGAIAVAIAKCRKDAQVDAVELYDDAFRYLEKNIKHNNADNVNAIKADALEFKGEYDLVVSNPPYIAINEKQYLSKEVLNEPHTALFAENDGLLFYEKIAENFKINKKFTLAFEIGYTMSERVFSILQNNGYSDISMIKDLNGIIRVIKAEK